MVRGCPGLVPDSISGPAVVLGERLDQSQAEGRNAGSERARRAVERQLLALEQVHTRRPPSLPIWEALHNGAVLRRAAMPAWAHWRWSVSSTEGSGDFLAAVEVYAFSWPLAVGSVDGR